MKRVVSLITWPCLRRLSPGHNRAQLQRNAAPWAFCTRDTRWIQTAIRRDHTCIASIDSDEGFIVQKDNPVSPKLFKVLQAPSVAPNAEYAISWLNPYRFEECISLAIIGWYTDDASKSVTDEGVDLDPEKFIENDDFVNFLHENIQKSLEKDEEVNLDIGAIGCVEGWTNVVDLAPCIRCAGADTVHIFGSIKVGANGIAEPGTYTRNPAHKLMTATGLFRLPDEIQQDVLFNLEVQQLKLLESFGNRPEDIARADSPSERRNRVPQKQKELFAEREAHPKQQDFNDPSCNEAAGRIPRGSPES